MIQTLATFASFQAAVHPVIAIADDPTAVAIRAAMEITGLFLPQVPGVPEEQEKCPCEKK